MKEGADYPATCVNHDDAVEFCHRLSKQEGVEYRLPTEAEWEYACRAGTTTVFSFGDDAAKLGQYGWYKANASDMDEKYAHQVGQKLPNPWGLYDMHGNASEWCQGLFVYYGSEKVDSDEWRPSRGGAFPTRPGFCLSATRFRSNSRFRSDTSGFRVATTYDVSP